MADHRPWNELAIPGASLLARCLGRGRILMDPGSALAIEILQGAANVWRRQPLDDIPTSMLQASLSTLLRITERISDELDSRDGL